MDFIIKENYQKIEGVYRKAFREEDLTDSDRINYYIGRRLIYECRIGMVKKGVLDMNSKTQKRVDRKVKLHEARPRGI